MSRVQIEIAAKNIEFARKYTCQLLEDLDNDDWFRLPHDGITHIAWQVGHLAMAEYALTMIRVRGKEREDAEWISNAFFKTFKKGTTPNPDRSVYPEVNEILATFNAVHEHAMKELSTYSDADLEESLPDPHAVFSTKMGSVFFCANHEMLHAGQIGLIRRLIGKSPIR